MLLHFVLVLHFAVIVITVCVSITFCGDYYILRHNIDQSESVFCANIWENLAGCWKEVVLSFQISLTILQMAYAHSKAKILKAVISHSPHRNTTF